MFSWKRMLAVLLALLLAAPAALAAGKPVVLWHTLEEMYRDDFARLNDAYAKEAGEEVTVEYQGRVAEILKKVLAANIAGGEELPHVFPVHSSEIKNLARDGVVENLDAYLKDAGVDLNDMNMSAAYAYEGSQYGLTWTQTAISVFYNKTVAEQEGISFPQKWEEMDAFLRRATIKNEDGTTRRYALWMPGWDSYYFTWLFWNFGVVTMDENGATELNGGKAKELVKQVKSWVDEGLIMWGYGSGASSNMRSAFWDGGVFAILHTSSQYRNHADNMAQKGFLLGVAMPPAGDKDHTTEVFGMALCIPAKLKTEEKARAFGLLKYLTSPGVNREMAAFTGFLANSAEAMRGEAGQKWLSDNPEMKNLYDHAADMKSAVQVPGYNAMTDVMEDSLAMIFLENAPVDETMNRMAEELTALFEDAK